MPWETGRHQLLPDRRLLAQGLKVDELEDGSALCWCASARGFLCWFWVGSGGREAGGKKLSVLDQVLRVPGRLPWVPTAWAGGRRGVGLHRRAGSALVCVLRLLCGLGHAVSEHIDVSSRPQPRQCLC